MTSPKSKRPRLEPAVVKHADHNCSAEELLADFLNGELCLDCAEKHFGVRQTPNGRYEAVSNTAIFTTAMEGLNVVKATIRH